MPELMRRAARAGNVVILIQHLLAREENSYFLTNSRVSRASAIVFLNLTGASKTLFLRHRRAAHEQVLSAK